MNDSSLREGGGALKPVILKVGIAFVISATGLILARYVSRKEDNEVTSSASNPECSSPHDGEETESLDHHHKEEILSLKPRIEELERKEFEMEVRFERYCKLKDQEVVLIEHKSMLSLEKSQLDFFRREVSAMEEEHKRGQNLLMVYLNIVGEIQGLRSENGLVEGNAKKLKRRGKQLYRVLYKKNRKSIGMEKKLLRYLDELEMKNNVVKELEDEVKDLKAKADVLQEEKEEISSNPKSEMVSVDEYKRLLEEYENMKKDFANGVKEVINLRWSTACLRHEVMRNGTNYGDIVFSPNKNLGELDLEDQMALTITDEHHEEIHHDHDHDHHHETSRRKRLMKKLKRWVEGNEKGKSTKSEERCFGRSSLTEEGIFHSRRSCSSL